MIKHENQLWYFLIMESRPISHWTPIGPNFGNLMNEHFFIQNLNHFGSESQVQKVKYRKSGKETQVRNSGIETQVRNSGKETQVQKVR